MCSCSKQTQVSAITHLQGINIKHQQGINIDIEMSGLNESIRHTLNKHHSFGLFISLHLACVVDCINVYV